LVFVAVRLFGVGLNVVDVVQLHFVLVVAVLAVVVEFLVCIRVGAAFGVEAVHHVLHRGQEGLEQFADAVVVQKFHQLFDHLEVVFQNLVDEELSLHLEHLLDDLAELAAEDGQFVVVLAPQEREEVVELGGL